jgi:putative NIF3 family GTP cyclohydrolase 1 type 2
MFPSADLLHRVGEWGADLLITHEPLFYDHYDRKSPSDPIVQLKAELLLKYEFAVFRYHDYAHRWKYDMIAQGVLDQLGLSGKWVLANRPQKSLYVLDNPITPRQLAKQFAEKEGLKRIRVIGAADAECRRLSLSFGDPGVVLAELERPEVDIVLTGEIREWKEGEYARDAAFFGKKKAIIVLGHAGSERAGMRKLAEILKKEYPGFETKYFECGEVFDTQE